MFVWATLPLPFRGPLQYVVLMPVDGPLVACGRYCGDVWALAFCVVLVQAVVACTLKNGVSLIAHIQNVLSFSISMDGTCHASRI